MLCWVSVSKYCKSRVQSLRRRILFVPVKGVRAFPRGEAVLRLDVAIPPWVGHGTAPPRNRGRGEPCRCSREQRCPYWPSLSRPRAELEVTAGAGDDTHAAHTSSDSDGGDCLLSSFSKKISCTLLVLGRRALTLHFVIPVFSGHSFMGCV